MYWQTVVGDNPGRVVEAVQRAKGRADIIITTGGLGPTCDDLTKNAIAEAFGLGLELNKEEERWLRELWRERHYTSLEITPNNLQQVMLPAGSTALRNDWGTAPGCCFEAEGVLVIMLPGPPREIRPMLEHRVRPILASLSDGVIASHTIHFFGIGESEMEYRLRDYMNSLTNPTLAPYAKNAECLVRVTASAPTRDEAERMMAPVIERVRDMFGPLAYGMDTPSLAEFTTKLLIERGVTLATAESCTGGELAKSVTDIPGASAALRGGVVVYTNEAKTRLLGVPAELIEEKGAVSHEVAVELARRVRELMDADFGVGDNRPRRARRRRRPRGGHGVHLPRRQGARLGAREAPRPARPLPGAALRLPARLRYAPPPPRRPRRGGGRAGMKLYLVRHGESLCNVERMLYGRTDCALTDKGREQARAVGEKLAGTAIERCVASPLIRAADTARIALAGRGVPIELDGRLMEQDMGEWENVHFPTLLEQEPELMRAMLTDWTQVVPPGGESYASVRARVEAVIAEAAASGRDTLFVAHNGPLSTVLALLLNMPDSAVNSLWFEQGCWSSVELRDGMARLCYFNK